MSIGRRKSPERLSSRECQSNPNLKLNPGDPAAAHPGLSIMLTSIECICIARSIFNALSSPEAAGSPLNFVRLL